MLAAGAENKRGAADAERSFFARVEVQFPHTPTPVVVRLGDHVLLHSSPRPFLGRVERIFRYATEATCWLTVRWHYNVHEIPDEHLPPRLRGSSSGVRYERAQR